MTTLTTPPGGTDRPSACRPPLTGPELREVFEVPPSLRMDDVGAFCPLDDVLLIKQPGGWHCPGCGAAWNDMGRDGRWSVVAQLVELADQGADQATSGRLTRVAVAVGAAAGAAGTVTLAHRYTEHASAVPEQLVYSPAVAVGLVGVVLAGRRIARWVGEHRHPLAVDVDEADLNPLGKELLAQVRARRGEAS
ncbi:hypothetical protein [Micromonospora sp. NPDC049274]|uniref:hypothetical protein n=1 Tax=Micromonospora sp. NPDC049274 TaxID=3154829 RepID=UPI003423CAEE